MKEPGETVAIEKTALQEEYRLSGGVIFDGVSFAYPTRREIPVLKNLDLEILPGEQVALVGPSGAGKSTVVSLLLQFYLPDSGELLFDGKNGRNIPLSQLRKQMAFVPQDVMLFGGTIRENIAYGDPDATDEQIAEAAKKANAHDFVSAFPEGYQTIVGERGIKLSGGQRQRIAIARAILKDPVILILDEATSSVDTRTEARIQKALLRLMKGRTSFVIAHRLSTIREATHILVIKDGAIIERGTHDQLLGQHGFYEHLYRSQFRGVAT